MTPTEINELVKRLANKGHWDTDGVGEWSEDSVWIVDDDWKEAAAALEAQASEIAELEKQQISAVNTMLKAEVFAATANARILRLEEAAKRLVAVEHEHIEYCECVWCGMRAALIPDGEKR